MTEWSEPSQELYDLLFGRGIYTRPEAPELGLLPRVVPFLSGPAVGNALLAALAIPDESVRLTTLFRLGQRLRATPASVQDDPRLRGLRQADRDALGGREPPPPPPIPGVPDDRLYQLLAADLGPEPSGEFAWGPPVDVVIGIYVRLGQPRDYDVLAWLRDRFAERGWDPDWTTLPMAGPPAAEPTPAADAEPSYAAEAEPSYAADAEPSYAAEAEPPPAAAAEPSPAAPGWDAPSRYESREAGAPAPRGPRFKISGRRTGWRVIRARPVRRRPSGGGGGRDRAGHPRRRPLRQLSRQRVVNTGFSRSANAPAPLSPQRTLACKGSYYFWLDIGKPAGRSIELTPIDLPAVVSPDTELTVALFAFDDELQVATGADIGSLRVQADQSVTVQRPVAQPELGRNSSELSERRLFFPIRTPPKPGVYRLRCHIYHEQLLLQSRVITARVTRWPMPFPRALRSVVDYTLVKTFEPAKVSQFGGHRLSVMVNESAAGTHTFRFWGEREFKQDASFDAGELQDLLDGTRNGLRRAAWGDESPWVEQRYRYDPPDLALLKEDLVRLAIRGYRAYDHIANRLAGGAAASARLAELMVPSGTIQIAHKESARLLLPAALLYDWGFDTNAPPSDFELCPEFLADLQAPGDLAEAACFRHGCPHREEGTTICPSGFWGFRHRIGLPVSVANAPEIIPKIDWETAPRLAVGVSTDAALIHRITHEQALRKLRSGLEWHYASDREQVFTMLRDTKAHLFYFYCHGGMSGKVPYIQVGPLTERGITIDNLRYKHILWDRPRPLVFINGCHTTSLEPRAAFEMVSGFVENAQASGVIGTEITVFEPLATVFAEACLGRFINGMPIGEAVRAARLALLKAGNPLGLVYVPWALASLRLVGGTEAGSGSISGE